MKTRLILTGVLFAFTLTGVANAQSGSGTLAVTANVVGSIALTFSTDTNGMVVTGTNTATASLPFGTVSMYGGSVPANVTKTVNAIANSFDLSTLFDICVDKANYEGSTFTVFAQLAVPDVINVWTLTGPVGPTNISSGASFAVTSTGAYGLDVPHTLKITVPATSAVGVISNTINFSVNAT